MTNQETKQLSRRLRKLAFNIWLQDRDLQDDPTGFCEVCGADIPEEGIYNWFCDDVCRAMTLKYHKANLKKLKKKLKKEGKL